MLASVGHVSREVRGHHADKPALIMAGSGLVQTYAELDAAANRLSRCCGAGLQPGDHVALCMENHHRYLEVVWGCHYAGLVYTACSSRLTSGELEYILNDCGAKVFITSKYKADQAAEIVADTPDVELRLMLDGTIDGYECYEAAVDRLSRPSRSTDRIAGTDMLYSSGTTGRPKGVARAVPGTPLDDGSRRACIGADAAAVRGHRRDRLPVAGAALPRRSAALLHGGPRASAAPSS